MIGVTLASPAMLTLATEAIRRFRDMTGLPSVMICPPDDRGAHMWKLRIPELVPHGPICYYDADWWMIRPADPRKLLHPGTFTAVKDVGVWNRQTFAFQDTATLGIERDLYFNSGFFVCDTREPRILDAFARAQELSRTTRVADFGEQSWLNAGVQDKALLWLVGNEWNTGPWAWQAGLDKSPCVQPIGLHAFGVPHADQKLQYLLAGERLLSNRHVPDLSTYNARHFPVARAACGPPA